MGFLSKLFGKKDSIEKGNNTKAYTENDNVGTRQDLKQAKAYWMARMKSIQKDPFVLYIFDSEEDAQKALLELPCIHVAVDSQELICTEVLDFGCYRTDEGNYHAIVCGSDLTHELWEQAKASFSKHGGRRKNDLEPEKRSPSVPKAKAAKSGKVVFVIEDRQQKMGMTMVYRIHKAPDAATAQAFLKQNPVTKPLYYMVVETPEGNYCCDIDGIYKE